jgi:Ca2+-binding RTX toxin-like protein
MSATVANQRFSGTEEVHPAPSAQGPQRDIHFAPLPDGGFVALWTDQIQSDFLRVVGQRFDSSGQKVGDFFVADSGPAEHHHNPSIAALTGGGFIATWSTTPEYFGGTGALQGQLFDSAGQKVGGVLTLHPTIADLPPVVEVVGLASGGFVLLWGEGGRSGFSSLRGQVFSTAGAPVGDEFEVKSYAGGYISNADIAPLPGGGFVVVWDTIVGDLGEHGLYDHAVRAQRFGADASKVGGEIAVNTTTSGTQYDPSVAALPGDGFVVAWTDSHADNVSGYQVKSQIFDLDGIKVGAEIVATPQSVNGQSNPTVEANADGEFVIGWAERAASSNPYEHPTIDIMGRLFDPSGAAIGDPFVADLENLTHPQDTQAVMLASGGLVLGWEVWANGNNGDVRLRVFLPVAQGTAGDDVLTGTDGRDVLEGLGGSDQISGGLEDDRLSGGEGNDSLDGGAGNDELEGGDGDDYLFGRAGDDFLYSGTGNDMLDGGEGDDRLRIFADGTDTAVGGAGSDGLIVDFREATTAVTSDSLGPSLPNGGYDGSISALGRSVSFTGIEVFSILTGSGDDRIRTGAGNDFLSLGAGDDLADVGAGVGSADGGSGIDGISADLSAVGRVIWQLQYNLFWLPDVGSPSSEAFKDFEYFVSVVTGSNNDALYTTGLALDDDITTGAGGDQIVVYNGHDVVRAGTGHDILSIDYSQATTDVLLTGFAASADGTGYDGRYGSGDRSVTFTGVERFGVETGSGNDVVRTGAGQDIVLTNGGDDFVDLGTGPGDSAFGGDGIDGLSVDLSFTSFEVSWNLVTGTFGYFYQSGFGQFEYLGTLKTGSADDIIVTSNLDRDERIETATGNDIVTVMNGEDFVDGGAGGIDALIVDYRNATTSVVVGPLSASAGGGHSGRISAADRSVDFTGIERLSIVGGSAADDLKGGDRNDVLDGGAGADTMAGGLDDDIYVVDDALDVVVEAPGTDVDSINTALAVYSLVGLPNVENLTATSDSAHDFRGNSAGNVITGGGGADVLRLNDGGDDTVHGGGGNDNIFFIGSLTGADVVNGGEGTDTLILQGPYGSLALTANVSQIENISILGGNNTNFGESGTNRYDYVLTTHDSNFAAGVQARINGSALLAGEDFTFDGSAETDALFVVYGGKGRDTLTGGLGNDIFFYAEDRFASGDTVNGGAGYDGMFLRGNYTIDFTAAGYTGLFTSIENLTLTSATDERYARGGGSEFDYNLTLSDAIVGAGQVLTVSGALLMGTETMVFDASAESDGTLRLFGGRASDTLKGGALTDLIHGNLGADTLAGGGGADAFRYQNIAESNSGSMDQILDFTTGTDKIELDRIDANTLVAGNQAFAWIGSDAFTGSAGQLRAYEQGGTWFVEGDVNGDSVADLVIGLSLQGPTTLGAGDFIL